MRTFHPLRRLACLGLLVLSLGAASDGFRSHAALLDRLDRALDAADWATVASLFTRDATAGIDPRALGGDVQELSASTLVQKERATRAALRAYRAERGTARFQAGPEGVVATRRISETATAPDGTTLTATSEEQYVLRDTEAGPRITRVHVRLLSAGPPTQSPANAR
jgi:hypothetical protein